MAVVSKVKASRAEDREISDSDLDEFRNAYRYGTHLRIRRRVNAGTGKGRADDPGIAPRASSSSGGVGAEAVVSVKMVRDRNGVEGVA